MTQVLEASTARRPRRGPPAEMVALMLLVPLALVLYIWLGTDGDRRQGSRAGQPQEREEAKIGPGPSKPTAAAASNTRVKPSDGSTGWRRQLPDLSANLAIALLLGVVAAGLIGLSLVFNLSEPLPQEPDVRTPPTPPPPPPPPQSASHMFVEDGRWKVIAASVAGTSHAKTDTPCQDATYSRVVRGDVLVAGVADGAGSARYGDEGSRIAVKTAVDTVADAVERAPALTAAQWQHVLRAAMRVALGHIEAEAALRGAQPRDLATTLLLFAATSRLLVAAQIGDGAIVVRDANGGLHALTTPQSGEYANTTTFLVSPDAFKSVQHKVWEQAYTGIAAFTDGLQRLALVLPKGDPYDKFFNPLFEFAERRDDRHKAIETIDAFLSSGKVRQRTDDDLTLMLARKIS